ncbi:unnamed protein product [Urochloa decumbens]|uniref:F-box domain-containing protein n=1 Tax=Urochloa decumbens TaxID=240449 RepID=A0ABC9BDG7_9POAL
MAAVQEENYYSLPVGFGTRPWLIQATRSESPDHPDFTVLVSSTAEAGDRFLLHSRPGDTEWTKMTSPFGASGITFSGNMISYKGKVYSFTSRSALAMIAIDLDDGVVRVRQVGAIEYDEEVAGSGYCVHLVESQGDLFAVWIQELGMYGNDGVLTDIVVYRLDHSAGPESMVWRTVEGIGDDRAFLLSGGYGFWCAVREDQMEGNCVYVVWSCCDCERLYKFCLDDMTTSFHQVNLSHDLINQHIDEAQGTSWAPWRDLPLELLEMVVANLSLVDCLRFPAVCKSWSKVSNPIEQAKVWPWLMHCSKRDGICKMFDPLRGKEYTLRVETLETDEERHIFRSSKDGWVVVSGGFKDECIFIINPFTGKLVEDPPMLKGSYSYSGISFSSNPASPDCLFFGINSSHSGEFVGVHTWRHGEDHWSEQEFVYQMPFPVAHNNPVLCRGKFYCLGRKGNLGVFDDLGSKDPRSAWKILDKPEPIHAEMDLFDHDHEGREFCFLVELKGELVSVFMRNDAEPPRVFKLDETKVAWIEVEDIGGATLFLDIRASYAVASPEGGHGNKIFFPRYSEDKRQAAFYDMETKMYCPSFYGLKQPLRCMWVMPSLHVDKILL